MLRTRRRGVLAAAALLATLATPARAAGPAAAPCTELAASPSFAADGTAACAGVHRDRRTGETQDISVFVTTDHGRSWRRVAASGMTKPVIEELLDVFFSPRYAQDRMLFVLSSEGLHLSTDLGATFALVHPTAQARMQPFVGVSPADGKPRTLVAMAHQATHGTDGAVLVLDPAARVEVPVAGSPLVDHDFAFSPAFATDGTAYAVGFRMANGVRSYGLYRCDATLTCTTLLHQFPGGLTLDRIWLAPDFPRSRTLYVSFQTSSGDAVHWWSRDGGKTLQRWTSVERLQGDWSRVATGLVGVPGTRTLYLRISGNAATKPGAAPYERLYRSGDDGASWRLVSYGRTPAQAGARGSMPPNTPRKFGWLGQTARGMLTVAGGRLFSLGTTYERDDVVDSFFCSADGGRTWRRTC